MPETTRVPPQADDLARTVTRITLANPGDRSLLRHSLGRAPKDVAPGVHRIVVPFVPEHTSEAAERAYYTVAALIAAQDRTSRDQARGSSAEDQAPDGSDSGAPQPPADWRRRNLGYSLALAADKRPRDRRKSLEDRLELLARQDLEGLYRHLPRLILYLRGDQVRIDWGVLIRDLTRWASDSRQVAKEWVQDYYRTTERLEAARKNNNAADERQDEGNLSDRVKRQ